MVSSRERPYATDGTEPSTTASSQKEAPWWSRYRWRQTSQAEGREAEAAVLRLWPGTSVEAQDVQIGPGKQDFLHTLVGGRADTQPPVVLMPGYGAGVGFYFRNFPSLCSRLRVYAVDWLGTGLSGRPSYQARTRQEAEAFFLDSLEQWRKSVGMEGKMILVGHSLGGYLSAQYALKHPEQVEHLVLVCPAGVPLQPEDWEKRWLGERWSWRGQMFKSFMYLWEKGVTPGTVIRGLGPWGRSMVHGYVGNRFSHHGEGLSAAEVDVFKHYFYNIAALPGSGEYALRHLLAPGAWAHAPLEGRLQELKVPVTFIYGREDWMKPEHAVRVCQDLRKNWRGPRAPNDLSVEIIDDAGHFVFIDQPELFDKALMNVILPYLKVSPEARSSAAAYTTEGIDVQVPEGLAAAAAAPGSGGPAATTWGFAASGLAAAGAGAGHGAGAGAPAGPEPGEEEVDEGVPAKPTA